MSDEAQPGRSPRAQRDEVQRDEVVAWLLDSDPALRWQVERDLVGAPDAVWQATRSRVATKGFGARLLAMQEPDGRWAGGAYFPHDGTPDEPQPWTATTWSLNQLREWGVDASELGDAAVRLDASARWEYDDLPYWGGEVDCCINGYTLANGAWLGADVSAIAEWLVEHRMADGGWNCSWIDGSTRSSFHSTINVLRGLLWHEQETGGTDALREARASGTEYLLERHLLRTRTTGETVGPWVSTMAYPFRWRYTALKAVDHLLEAAVHDGAAPDRRMADAVALVRDARQPEGRWLQDGRDPGRVWFEVDVPRGEPSRWVTFLAMRALERWQRLAA